MASRAFYTWNRRVSRRAMPFRALLQTDLLSMSKSWVVRIWLFLMAAQALITVPAALESASAPDNLASLLGTFPIIWSTFVIIISAGAVAAESGVVADSILSKSVTRYEYILAKFAARLLTVLGLYLLVTVPAAYLISRYAQPALDLAGVVWGLTLVGVILVLLTSLSVALSALFNRTLVALVVVWILWYAAGGIFGLLDLQVLSPLYVVNSLPDLFVGDYQVGDQLEVLAGFLLPSVVVVGVATAYFSGKDL